MRSFGTEVASLLHSVPVATQPPSG